MSRSEKKASVEPSSDLKKELASLRESESRLRMLLDNMSDGLIHVDGSENIIYLNNCFSDMTGYSREELLGSKWTDLLVDEGPEFIQALSHRRQQGLSDRYEVKIRNRAGEFRWVLVGGTPMTGDDGNVVGSMGVLTDITDRKRAEEQLRHNAFHDALTGLANRLLFMDYLKRAMERHKSQRGKHFAVLYLDFDRFKVINDSLGHAEGDRLLQFIARRLENCIRTGDLIARLGGDEFAILLSDLDDTSEVLLIAERIQNDLKLAFDLGGREIFTSTSIGIALSTDSNTGPDEMLRAADIAMYFAKSKGKAQYAIFDAAMHKHSSKRLQIETEMRAALEKGQFSILYQPILGLSTGALYGFEALLRWLHPERGLIPPDEFIPVAEDNGMIMKLGQMVLDQSCRQLCDWQSKLTNAAELVMSVNLSSKEFLQLDLAEKVAAKLRETGLDPRFLKLEITESHIMENSELAVMILKRLQDLGVDICLDDFGTGYSSLSYLHRLPVQSLKIDRSFVGRMTQSDEHREIVNTIVRLAQNLKMKIVAEGIETTEQLVELSKLDCDYGQGYYFSKPLSAREARVFILNKARTSGIALYGVEEHLGLTM